MSLDTLYHEIVNGYTRTDWKPLFDLIPEIENAPAFVDQKGGFHKRFTN